MHSKILLLIFVLSTVSCFGTKGLIIKNYPSIDTNTVAIWNDTVKSKIKAENVLFDLNILFAEGRNNQFFNGYFQKGRGIQLAFNLYKSRYYSIRFKTAYINYKFDIERFRYANNIEGEIKTTNPETISLLPDIQIHPLPDFFINPYVFLGIGMQVGSKDAAITILDNSGTYKEGIYQFGSRFISQFGIGFSKRIINRIHINASYSRNIEFLENTQSKDIFYNFKDQIDGRSKYNYISFGFQYMIK